MKIFTCAFALVAYVAGASFFSPLTVSASEIDKVWSVDVDQRLPNSPVALSSPAVLKYNDESLVVLAGRDGWVHVYNLNSGSQEHRFSLGAPSDSGALALSNGLVVLSDIQGHLYGIDPIKGEVIWKKDLTAGITVPPVTIDNDFLVQTADNEIYRFSENGEKRWSYTGLKNTLSLYLGAAPLVENDIVYAVFNNGDTVALKAYTGDLLWKRQVIVASASAQLSALQAPLAKPVLIPNLHLGGEEVSNALLVPIFQGELAVIAADDGSQPFSSPVSLKSSPVLIAEKMYMADSSGFLHLNDIKTGKRLWSKKIASTSLMGPVLFDDSLWLTDAAGMVYRINMEGDVDDSLTLQGSIARLPIVTEYGLIIRTDRGLMVLVK